MQILAFLDRGFRAPDLTGPTAAGGPMPGHGSPLVSGTDGPATSDIGLKMHRHACRLRSQGGADV